MPALLVVNSYASLIEGGTRFARDGGRKKPETAGFPLLRNPLCSAAPLVRGAEFSFSEQILAYAEDSSENTAPSGTGDCVLFEFPEYLYCGIGEDCAASNTNPFSCA